MKPGNVDYGKEFEELFKANYSRLFYCALDYVEDAEAAKDIVSELFADVWRQYVRLREERIEPYLLRAVRNRSLNYLRHQAVEQRYCQQFVEQRRASIDEDNSRHEADLRKVDSVMQNFTPQTKLIFEQCYFEGKKYQEVADMLHISASAVHKHITKAFAAFRKALLPEKEPPER